MRSHVINLKYFLFILKNPYGEGWLEKRCSLSCLGIFYYIKFNCIGESMLKKNDKGLYCLSILAMMPLCVWANAPENYAAILKGHVMIPAESFIAAPENAPDDLKISGKFTTLKRVTELGSVEGLSKDRPIGVSLPFKGQPIQGHSGIKRMQDGTFWVLTDNGAGSKANSPDFMLYLNHYKIDFKSNQIENLATIFLHDPDQRVPFRIANEATKTRYLTGSDFDPESFQWVNDQLWIGDEFGPYLIQADQDGKIIDVFDTMIEGKVVHSPDHPQMRLPGSPTESVQFEVNRSKGFEGMALSADKHFLYAMLEGSIYDADNKTYESKNNSAVLRVLEFDVQHKKWTGNYWFYPLENAGYAIGDFNMINKEYGLVIERDNNEGVSSFACSEKDVKTENCFPQLPVFKRIYLVQMTQAQMLKKVAYIDLLAIEDPDQFSKVDLVEGKFVFPFFTIENVDIVDQQHIIVGNDNNLPFSSSRQPNQADANEFILLEVKDFLAPAFN